MAGLCPWATGISPYLLFGRGLLVQGRREIPATFGLPFTQFGDSGGEPSDCGTGLLCWTDTGMVSFKAKKRIEQEKRLHDIGENTKEEELS